ncbi:MAG: DUF2919 domain-containing protein [Thiohalocapsa sp. PB-PSB1]|jgi:hypothetical protein|nr:MAG: hypothetical protein N838_07780 [Thiohalocapsa sp. PB-PSB1]QQO55389.1 MAG: DUF2919 domain-containing protein [Thiohalocapsa sp. PB-PSB1]HCS92781.1 DUF2919 domain-containing protein [Chromatiaceae bacterium]
MLYDPSHYDEHLNLKVPFALWLVLAFLLRHLLLLGITFLPTTGEEINFLRDLIHPVYLACDLIALPVAIVAIRRRPGASPWMRRLWSIGRTLLSISALLYLVLLAGRIGLSGEPLTTAIDELTLISALLHLAIIVYLWRSPLVRDLFREFPARD